MSLIPLAVAPPAADYRNPQRAIRDLAEVQCVIVGVDVNADRAAAICLTR